MRRRVCAVSIVIICVLLPTALSEAQSASTCPGVTTTLTGYDGETLTVGATVKTLTESKYKSGGDGRFWAKLAAVSTEGDALRYWDNGSTPTANSGHKVAADTPFLVCGQLSLRQLKMIRVTGDVTIFVSYYR